MLHLEQHCRQLEIFCLNFVTPSRWLPSLKFSMDKNKVSTRNRHLCDLGEKKKSTCHEGILWPVSLSAGSQGWLWSNTAKGWPLPLVIMRRPWPGLTFLSVESVPSWGFAWLQTELSPPPHRSLCLPTNPDPQAWPRACPVQRMWSLGCVLPWLISPDLVLTLTHLFTFPDWPSSCHITTKTPGVLGLPNLACCLARDGVMDRG